MQDRDQEAIVKQYFGLFAAIQAGDVDAVDDMMALWDPDGWCEFVGPEPMTGEFRGRMAIGALYSNIARTPGRKVCREEKGAESTLADRGMELGRSRAVDDKLVIEWSSAIGDEEGRGFNLEGSNTFTFKDGKISSLRIVSCPKPGEIGTLDISALTINDIGRLSLAAWAVV